MPETDRRSAFERFLGLFAEVRQKEGVTVLLLTLNVFLVLTSYYLAKVVRESLILGGWGAEIKSYSSAGQVFLLLVAVRVYAWLAGKFPRKRLINVVNIFFSACMVLFFILARLEIAVGIVFFLWVGMFNVMVVAQFWSFANDIYSPEQGKRLFAIVAFGASSGAVLGSFISGRLIPTVGVHQLLLVAAGVLLVSLLITNIIDARERGDKNEKGSPEGEAVAGSAERTGEKAFGKEGAFKLVFANKYLLMIAFLILLLNWVNTTGEYILGRAVQEASLETVSGEGAQEDFIGKFYADFFTAVNLTGLLIQLFLVSRILKYLGVRIALLILPFIALGGYVLLAIYPVLTIVRWAKTAENATDYSLNNTVRHVLFLPTSREEKYKAKQAIDSFFHRSGDVLSAMLVFAGVHWFGFNITQFALVNLSLVLVWLVLAFGIGRRNRQLVEQKPE